MNQVHRLNLPIGYWPKRTDEVLTKHINDVQTSNVVSRFQWQVLNAIYESGVVTRAQLFETMQTFVDEAELEQILTELSTRGWLVKTDEGVFQLSDEGRLKHQIILESQKKVRQRAMQDIGEEDYATVISVLQRIVQNLEGETT
jgi:DNA-binding MarR family transcriptional regulator